MRESATSSELIHISPSLIGFKPRQVLLAQKQQQTLMGKNNQLKPEQDSILTYSVALWLENKGFSKVLKRFISSALIQDEDWKTKALDLNEVFSKHLVTISSNDVQDKEIPLEKKETLLVDSAQINGEVNGEKAESKKKKKRNKGKDAVTENGKIPDEMTKSEKVKKSKGDVKQEKNDKAAEVLTESKPKSELTENNPDSAVEKKVSKKRSIDATEGDDESKKASKKRKKMAVDEADDHPSEEAVQEPMAKNSKDKKEGKDIHAHNKEETTAKDIDVGSKDDVKTEVAKFSNSKSGRKQNGNSSEPKTVKAFQRVKIDEVKFADERLQDNSYWAKDGAEIGYGAKAQEVLGQVRGRDFRHEKTKKKRGSYRGGQIDLQSHSIKFDNSDDE